MNKFACLQSESEPTGKGWLDRFACALHNSHIHVRKIQQNKLRPYCMNKIFLPKTEPTEITELFSFRFVFIYLFPSRYISFVASWEKNKMENWTTESMKA